MDTAVFRGQLLITKGVLSVTPREESAYRDTPPLVISIYILYIILKPLPPMKSW